MSSGVYRGRESDFVVVHDDGRRSYDITVIPMMGGHGVSWPGPNNGTRQLAFSLLYDLLGWVPAGTIAARLEREVVASLSGSFELAAADLADWWRRQPESAAGLVFFHGTVPPLMDHRALEAYSEACRDAGFATYLPHENTTPPHGELPPAVVDASNRAASSRARFRIAYAGLDGARALDTIGRFDIFIVDRAAPLGLRQQVQNLPGAKLGAGAHAPRELAEELKRRGNGTP
jgi:hypothetical protein